MKSAIEVQQRIKSRSTIWFSNSTSGCLSEENKNNILKSYMHSYVHCSIIYKGKIEKYTKCPSIYEWIKKTEYYLAIKKNKICNNKYGPRGYFAKCIKADRERQIWYNFIYMWSLKKKKKDTYKKIES